MRDVFIAMPLSAIAVGELAARNRAPARSRHKLASASPSEPLPNVSASSSGAVIASAGQHDARTTALAATQNCVNMNQRRRLRMSASAPLGSPNITTGSTEADCTSATIAGDVVNVVISQAAATSFIHMQMFAVSHVPQSSRNTGRRNGAHGEGTASLDAVDICGGGVIQTT